MKRKNRHAGAEARRASEHEQVAALATAADPSAASGAELVRAVNAERQEMAAEYQRSRTLPRAEKEKLIPQLTAQRDRIQTIEAELARRPVLRASEDGLPHRLRTTIVDEPPAPRPKPPERDWPPVLPVLPQSLGTLTTATLQDLFNEHTEALRLLRDGKSGDALTVEQRAVEVAIGRYEVSELRSWITGEARAREKAEKNWLSRKIDELSVGLGLAKRTPGGAVVALTEEEVEMFNLARRRAERGPDPQALSVAAAVFHYFVAEDDGWSYFAGDGPEVAALTDADGGAFLIAVGLIARNGDGLRVTVRARAPLAGTRAECPGFLNRVEHLSKNGLLVFERRLPEVTIGLGPVALEAARRAGVKLPMPGEEAEAR